MAEMNVVNFDPVPKLEVTKLMEQTMLLLLGLYRLKRAEAISNVVDYIRVHNFWRGTQPDWEKTWQDHCLKRAYVKLREGQYMLTIQGRGWLLDCCTLFWAMRDPFIHLTSGGYHAACGVRRKIRNSPFTNRQVSQKPVRSQRGAFHVYVILLKAEVVTKYPYLLEINPERRTNYPCIYVGYTSSTPENRLNAHKKGRQASQIVRDYGICLVPDLYADLNPIRNYNAAVETEGIFANSLRNQGYTVTAGHHDWE